jgi:hypothetical protein
MLDLKGLKPQTGSRAATWILHDGRWLGAATFASGLWKDWSSLLSTQNVSSGALSFGANCFKVQSEKRSLK